MFLLCVAISLMMGQCYSEDSKPLFSFDKGGVGVNFLGFHASAGLGGLLTGNSADGGLHAEAGTPFGQRAGAGLGGGVDADGRAGGGLYAGATAGGGVRAAAGLGGYASGSDSVGGSYAGASAGGAETHVAKIARPQTTYVEKKVRVPAYVEKTVRVPVVVEKTKIHGRKRPHVHSTVRFKNIGYGTGGVAGTTTITKTTNPQLFDDIVNIPVSTLEAVRKLLGGIADGTSGSVTVTKRVGASKYY